MSDLFLNALSGKNLQPAPPVWLMRQAGRYMQSYRNIRAKYSFIEILKNPELIVEITKLPIDQFGFDAAIIFSDILLIAEPMGIPLRYEEGIGPVIDQPISQESNLEKLVGRDLFSDLSFLRKAIRNLKSELKVPLIGFAGAPFTVATYLIEGRGSHNLKKTKRWLNSDPTSFFKFLDIVCKYTIDLLNLFKEEGIAALQLFESVGYLLTPNQFETLSLFYTKKIRASVAELPFIYFCRGGSSFVDYFGELESTAISLDWNSDLAKVREKLGPKVTLQGNLDPALLLGSRENVVNETRILLEKMKGDPAFILNLGHGILPETPEENVYALCDTVKKYAF